MNYRVEDGWLSQAKRVESPNFEARPAGCEPELLVLHNISLPPGSYGTGCIQQFFTNCLDHTAHPFFAEIQGVQVSAHLLIERTGALIQFVNFNARAWHAGESSFEGREGCNDFSIGIELEGTDDDPYTSLQYFQLIQVVRALFDTYPGMTSQRIVGHSDIAPGRKTDPGPAFEWTRLQLALEEG